MPSRSLCRGGGGGHSKLRRPRDWAGPGFRSQGEGGCHRRAPLPPASKEVPGGGEPSEPGTFVCRGEVGSGRGCRREGVPRPPGVPGALGGAGERRARGAELVLRFLLLLGEVSNDSTLEISANEGSSAVLRAGNRT